MMRTPIRATTRATAVGAAVLVLSGCGFRGAYSFDLPGGADVGDEPYTVQVEFLDALDLVPQSGVRVADVPVGRVEEIELDEDDWTALVTISVNGDTELPANAVAAIQQSSLLGEKYVELAPPGNEDPQGALEDGARITLERTSRNVEVEELLGALSLVLNGGGLAQLQTINRELGDALEGREAEIKDTFRQLEAFVGGLDDQKEEINRALENANALAETLASRTGTIETALDTIGPGLEVINEQRDLLVSMLESLARLGDVGTRIINASAANTIEDLRLLQPILSQLAAAGPDLANSYELLLTYPFPDSAVFGTGRPGGPVPLNYRGAQSGGAALFTNFTANVDLDLTDVLCQFVVNPGLDTVLGDERLEVLPADEVPTDCNGGGPFLPQPRDPGAGGGPTTPPPGGGPLPTLPDVTGQVVEELPEVPRTQSRAGLPAIPGVEVP